MNKGEKKIYQKAWRQSHKEHIKAYNKAYREAHKKESKIRYQQEEIKEWYKAYYKTNRKKLIAQAKARHHANAEKNKARCKAYYIANSESINAQMKIWHKANPEKIREYDRKRRALERTTQVEPINEKKLYLRDGWMCQICKKRVDKRFKYPNPMCASMDHIVPLYKGGSHTYKNVQLAHLRCNFSKQTATLPQGEQTRLF